MSKILKKILLLSLLAMAGLQSFSQEKPPFWDDVKTIQDYDKIYAPPKDPILFVGSSSIRLWVDFVKTFKNYTVLNRGIGGAVTSDIDRYLDQIVFPYHPKQIVLYVGENDIIGAPDAETVFNSFEKLYAHIRTQLPSTPIVYLAMKGSPSRKQHQDKAVKANRLIRDFIKQQQHIIFLDIYAPMLDKKGEMQPRLFKNDMLHMNLDGYKIWNGLLIPHLLKD